MNFFTSISDFLLYVAFSIIAGSVLLKFIPHSHKPEIREPRWLLMLSVIGIALFSLAPVIELLVFLDGGFGTFFAILLDYRTGHGWVITALISLLLGITIYFGGSKYMAAYYTLALILAVGFFSHASTLNLWGGFISHTVHFLVLVLWAGVLLQAAWFSNGGQWERFLAWFTPFASACVAILLISGFIIMLFFVAPADYANSWVLPYGQLLLLKHLSIIPLLLAAAINGFLNKKRLYQQAWLKAESILLLATLALTAFMSKEAPPHDVNETLRFEGAAPFIEAFMGPVYIPISAVPDFSLNGLLLLGIALLCLVMVPLSYKRSVPAGFSVLFGIGFIAAAYGGLMLSTTF
ncbi:CopD family protein [Planococcus sp. APC 3906]|uniref:copper resistance D family protein n=1 Tax=Planococcus sp. APC 3906 TaxID=3035194 RepID=UPI0025B2BB66|nr:CopD family protein [Planococcus sp. APC 3906]MDN3448795.1 CopD family protein [Planococcus sp. APC 3906]